MNSTNTTIPRTYFRKESASHFELEVVSLAQLEHKIIENYSPRFERMEFYLCMHITKGSGVHIVDFTELKYGPGSTIMVSKYQIQKWVTNKQVDGWVVMFTDDLLNALPEDTALLFDLHVACTHTPVVLNNKDLNSAITSLQNEYVQKDDAVQKTILVSQLRVMVCQIIRQLHEKAGSISIANIELYYKYRRLLEAEFITSRTAQYYAEKLCVSSKTLSRTLKRVTGETIKESIDNRIVLEAKRLLLTGNRTTKDVCYALDFDEPTNFVKYFKRIVGQTPQGYQQEQHGS
ncbi:MAG: helix-turn-helix domain-containing protein [Fibrobacterales bacterium]